MNRLFVFASYNLRLTPYGKKVGANPGTIER